MVRVLRGASIVAIGVISLTVCAAVWLVTRIWVWLAVIAYVLWRLV